MWTHCVIHCESIKKRFLCGCSSIPIPKSMCMHWESIDMTFHVHEVGARSDETLNIPLERAASNTLTLYIPSETIKPIGMEYELVVWVYGFQLSNPTTSVLCQQLSTPHIAFVTIAFDPWNCFTIIWQCVRNDPTRPAQCSPNKFRMKPRWFHNDFAIGPQWLRICFIMISEYFHGGSMMISQWFHTGRMMCSWWFRNCFTMMSK